jgi:predicted phosphodiesterase
MNILTISDIEVGIIYSTQIRERFKNVDLVISCGDLPYYYLEYIVSMLNVPLYYVRGNHAAKMEYGEHGSRTHPWGGSDLHRRCVRDRSGLLMAGIEGSLQYNYGPYQ